MDQQAQIRAMYKQFYEPGNGETYELFLKQVGKTFDATDDEVDRMIDFLFVE